MPTLRTILVRLGPSGATANALAVLDQRVSEERAVAALEAHIVPPTTSRPRVGAHAA